jgi:hypothetical protein
MNLITNSTYVLKNRITKSKHSVIISTCSLPFVQLSRKLYDLQNVSFICIISVRNIFRPEMYLAKYNTDTCKIKNWSCEVSVLSDFN